MSGIIFPITALPAWAQSISKVLPITYWMDSMRRALMPEAMAALSTEAGVDVTGLGSISDLYIMAYLAISVAVFFVLSLAVFRFADGIARRKGKIDWTTAY
jgi:ABC-2 type transport system permease protein